MIISSNFRLYGNIRKCWPVNIYRLYSSILKGGFIMQEFINSTEDYWDVYFALMQDIPTALGEHNIGGPSSPVSISK